MARFGEREVHAGHALAADDLLVETRPGDQHVIIKTHGFPAIAEVLQQHRAKVIVSVRDPRDAVLSLIERFGTVPDVALRGIARDCAAALACADAGFLTLRYENGFFKQPAAIRLIAKTLDLETDEATVDRIFTEYGTEAVRVFANGLKDLPADRLDGTGSFRFDRLTQITNTHIGDGRVGKWRDRFDKAQQAGLTRFFASFLQRFGYET